MKMYKLLSVIIIFSTSITLSAQQDSLKLKDSEFEIITVSDDPPVLMQNNDEKTYIYVNKMPEFPGGPAALRKFISRNVVYPNDARTKGIVGVVFLRFQVKKDGTIGVVQIQKGVHKLLDEASINVVKSLPPFEPAEHNGKKVSVWYSIPVSFRLN